MQKLTQSDGKSKCTSKSKTAGWKKESLWSWFKEAFSDTIIHQKDETNETDKLNFTQIKSFCSPSRGWKGKDSRENKSHLTKDTWPQCIQTLKIEQPNFKKWEKDSNLYYK